MGLLLNISALVCFAVIVTLNVSIGSYLTVKSSGSKRIHHSVELAQLDDKDHNTFVFVHISDLHISHFNDPERYDQLKEFCLVNLKAIRPRLVVASGDLTDSIAPDKVIATQFIEEWKMYQNVYTMCQNVSDVTHWLDLRGNHDNFNVDGYNSTNSFYPKFGSQRSQESGSYMVTVQTNANTKYAFIGVDATLQIGPKRILNFVGQLDDNHLTKLEKFEKSAMELNVNASIWFGHYPTSSILSTGLLPGLRHVAAKGIAYLCGHFHTWGGIVPQMYSQHHSGMLELELADWKHNRMYRVAVLDQGLFSFTDVQHKAWPVIVVTNPKPLITVQPSKEPVYLMSTSSHIRIFIFSPSPIEICEVKLDDGAWETCKLTGENLPLFTAPWKPDLYIEGRHVLEVRAKDYSGSEVSSRIDFALDNSHPYFPLMARVALMIDITTISQVIFAVTIILSTVPFGIIRYLQNKIIHRQMTMWRIRNRWLRMFIRKIWIFASINLLFYPFLAYTLYLAVGPWFIGHLIDGRIGMVCVWGSFFQGGIFLPGTMTFFYGSIHLWFFNGILLIFLSYAADVRFQEVVLKSSRSHTSWRKMVLITSFVIFIGIHAFTCYLFWLSYGDLATFLNPMRTWSLIFAACLLTRALCLDEFSLKDVAKTWISN